MVQKWCRSSKGAPVEVEFSLFAVPARVQTLVSRKGM